MASEPERQALERAAARWGIALEYWDIWGRRHVTSPETMRAILGDLGVPAGDAGQLARATAEHVGREWRRLVPPTLVVSGDTPPQQIYLHVPESQAGGMAQFLLRLEDGEERRFEASLAEAPAGESADLDGCRYVRKPVAVPFPLPLGYHDLEVAMGGQRATLRLIVTPDRAYAHPALEQDGKAAGIAVALYGLRSSRNWGCGDLTDLHTVIDWVAGELQASFVALNPLHAIHNRRPFNTSPYLPNSIFYQNFLYLDVERIEDFPRSGRAQRVWRQAATAAEVEALRGSEFVEYERVAAFKLRFLKLAFLHFLREYRAGTARAREFQEFIRREGDLLERFAVYCALDEWLHRRNPEMWVWTQWPAPYRDPDSPETRAFRARHWRAVFFYQYVQWQLDLQLAAAQAHARGRGLSIGLYHDLALATDRFGSDLWAHRPFFVAGCRVGSPPDDFSPKGQDWAFPPPDSDHHRETGYRLFAESIRKNCRHGGALRIDHVMRFFRLYWIPHGEDATHGTYVQERYQDLIRILALESVRNRVVVVGEDLGTVEPVVRETLTRFGILGYRLLYFEKNEHGGFRSSLEYPAHALVSSTTHDLPTVAGFWTSEDIEARRRAGLFPDENAYRAQLAERAREKQKLLEALFGMGLLPDYVPRSAEQIPALTGELHNAMIGFLALTPSLLLAVNQEDLTKEPAQQNLPGTTWQYPNWSRKMRFTLEQLWSDSLARDYTAMLRNWLSRSGRLNRPEPRP